MKTSSPVSAVLSASNRLFSFRSGSTLLLAAALLGKATILEAAENQPAPAPAPAAPAPATASDKNSTPIVSADEEVRKNLAELERLLDLPDSKLEEILRKNLEQLVEDATPKNAPELEVVLKERPWIRPTLKKEQQFLLHRYIARRVRGPLLRNDVIALDKFLAENPDIRRALNREPSQIVNGNFLMAHPSLAEFLTRHPSLSTILLTPESGRKADGKGK